MELLAGNNLADGENADFLSLGPNVKFFSCSTEHEFSLCSQKLKNRKIKIILSLKLSDVVFIMLINILCQQLLAF